MTKALDLQKDKRISTDSLLELSECVLKNTISEQNSSFYKRLRGEGGESVILRKDFLIIVIFRL